MQTVEQTTRWRFTEAFLIEERPEGSLLWGRWDRSFGCWDESGRPVEPDRPLLKRLGLWFEPEGARDDGWYASRAALAAYWSLVPTPVRLAAAKRPAGQWGTLREMWARR